MLPVTLTLLPDLRLVDPREYCEELKKIVGKYTTIMARRMVKQVKWKENAPAPLSARETQDARIRVYQLNQDLLLNSTQGKHLRVPESQHAYIVYFDYSDIFCYDEWKRIRVGIDHNPIRTWFHDAHIVAALAQKENLYGDFYTDNETKATLPASPTFKDPRTHVVYKRKKIITRAEVGNDIILSQMDLSESCDKITKEFEDEKRWLTTSKHGVQLLQSIISKRNTKDREEENKARKLTYAIVFVNK